MSIIIFNKDKFIGNGINFMNNVFFIVICGLFLGVIFGLFYQNVFLRTEFFLCNYFSDSVPRKYIKLSLTF
jgi:hypothetical protein